METLVMIISILLIIIVILQSGKAEGGSLGSGVNNSALFVNRKVRGSELCITRLTAVLGAAFFIICVIMSL